MRSEPVVLALGLAARPRRHAQLGGGRLPEALAHPKLAPYCDALLGPGYRLDHQPMVLQQDAGSEGFSLHGGPLKGDHDLNPSSSTGVNGKPWKPWSRWRRIWSTRRRALDCVEINQCVGCTHNSSLSHFGNDAPTWLGRAARNRHATPSSRRRVDGVEDDAMIQHERVVKF